jgi:hypothetical protein
MLIEKDCLKGSLQPIVIDPFDMKASRASHSRRRTELGRFLELAFCNDTGTEVRGCPGEKTKSRLARA